jgi:hypothetical protein
MASTGKLDGIKPAGPWRSGSIGRAEQSGYLGGSGGALLDQALNGWGSLRAHADPVGQTVLRNAQAFFATLGNRVVKPDALDEATIAANPLVGYDDIEKRTVLGTAACKSNDDHDLSFGWWDVKINTPQCFRSA